MNYYENLIATYEQLLPIEENDRITRYLGDYGMYVIKWGVTQEQIVERANLAVQAMRIDYKTFLDTQRYSDRHEILKDMANAIGVDNIENSDYIKGLLNKYTADISHENESIDFLSAESPDEELDLSSDLEQIKQEMC